MGRFNLGVVKSPLLEVNRTATIGDKTVGCVVSIGRVKAMENPFPHVRLAIAIGIFQIHQVWCLGDNHSSIVKIESRWVVQIIGKNRQLVGFAIFIGVFQNENFVIHGIFGLPVRVGWPNCHPQPALGIPSHLHRIT